jgi:hypothetical protein
MTHNTVTIVIIAAVALLVVWWLCKNKKKEGYSEVFLTTGVNDSMVQRPTFKPNLAPRFDPFRESGGYIRGSYPNSYDVQAIGPSPIEDMASLSNFDYATLGGEDKMNEGFNQACKKVKAGQYQLGEEVALASMDYTDPKDLLPEPDMRACFKDPTNPENYMYERTLYAPLKQRTTNYPDRIRGDLYIPPIRTGWFDSPCIPNVDLARGATQGFIADVMGVDLELEDASYLRNNPTQAVKFAEQQAVQPFGASTSSHFL